MTGKSSKRPASSIESRPGKRPKRYSTRQPPWEEQRELGDLFREAGEGSWPVVRILKERTRGKKRQFLVEWCQHPKTGEIFKPEWLDAKDVSVDLEEEWSQLKEQDLGRGSSSYKRDSLCGSREVLQTHDIPEFSESELVDANDQGSPPALISGRESSVGSGVEIFETQELVLRTTASRALMETNGVRQSPRLASATPETGKSSPKVSTRSSSRHRTAEDKEIEPTPLRVANSAADIEVSKDEDTAMFDDAAEEHNANMTGFAEQSESATVEGDFAETLNSGDDPSVFDSALSANMIHESIEEEPPTSSATTTLSLDSKANSSQESLNNEQMIASVDGTMIPSHPLLGPNEYAIPLPAEGKIKSVYDELIKERRKALLRFISRKGSPGNAEISNKKTSERLAMQDLIQRLNNTCTHVDLGMPPLTDYSLSSPDNASYAEYAGSKFAMLGAILEHLKGNECCFVVMAQAGVVQDLLENFCKLKHAQVRRYDRQEAQKSPASDTVIVDLLTTQSDRVIDLPQKPLFIVAFDVSFATSDPQVQRIRQNFGNTLPILHFLISNSSEHVERCVPESLPSNVRLRVVVRTTWLASSYLGGSVSYFPDPEDGISEGRPMDMGSLQRLVRKGPARKMALMSDVVAAAAMSNDFAGKWTLGNMPELSLDDYVDTPPKISRAASTTPQPGLADHKSLSRATTPVAKKRHLEVEPENFTKRQRLTPLADGAQNPATTVELTELRQQLASLRSELVTEQAARKAADKARAEAEIKAAEWRNAHSDLQRRYEKRRSKTKALENTVKTMTGTIETSKSRQEKAENERGMLKDQVTQLRSELTTARSDLKAAGGDVALLEEAREEARKATTRQATLEKSLENTKKDFEFTRQQYQDASNKAAEMASQVSDLELQIKRLELAASDSKRGLKALNYEHSIRRHIEAAERVKLEVRNRDAVIKKLQDENTNIKSKRGVQTRGSSVQPGGSPGPRSRQASPAPGFLAPPSHTRASMLRNER